MQILEFLLFASFPLVCFGLNSCPQSVPTVSFVPSCPSNETEWRSAALKKDCNALKQQNNCSEDDSFQYHCVINEEATTLVEVCAPTWYMAGYCARFSISEARLINDPRLDCTKFSPSCPSRFLSNESFKYQTCYTFVNISPASLSKKQCADNPLLYYLLAILGTVLLFLLILLVVGYQFKWIRLSNHANAQGLEGRWYFRARNNSEEKFGLLFIDPNVSNEATQNPGHRRSNGRGKITAESLFSRNIRIYDAKDIKTIGDLRKKLCEDIREQNEECIWIVDKEHATFLEDDAAIKSDQERYTWIMGNSCRTSNDSDANELNETPIDVINNKPIATNVCKMSCGHYTGPETLFDWVKNKLHGHLDETFVCPSCEKNWTKDEVFKKCNLSVDEQNFFDIICYANERTLLMMRQVMTPDDEVNPPSESSGAENDQIEVPKSGRSPSENVQPEPLQSNSQCLIS